MSERLPFPTDLFRASCPAGVHDDAEVIRLMRLSDRGEYLEAAQEASGLLQTRGRDPRLIAVYLAGSFVERGVVGLSEILNCVATELGGSGRESEAQTRQRDAAVKWLCRVLTTHIAFHTAQRSEVWERWLTEIGAERVAEIGSKCVALGDTHPGCVGALAKIGRWSQEKLGPASARVRKTMLIAEPEDDPAAVVSPASEPNWYEAEPEPEPELAPEPAPEPAPVYQQHSHDHSHDDERPHEYELGFDDGPAPPAAAMMLDHPPSPIATNELGVGLQPLSPPLTELCEKLRGFELLIERGELDKAAIVASDIQAVIERFDPLVYLPNLFGRYCLLLSKVIHEVEARWNAGHGAAWRVLEQFYRVDLDRFINDE